ncbi:MAG TPA: hypothetical protein VGI70_08860, partial [Polyangiales bacterium]
MQHAQSPISVICALTCLGALLNISPVSAQSPADLENTKLAERVIKAGKDPRGEVPLLELWDNWDKSTPQKLLAELTRLSKQASFTPARKVLIETMVAQAKLRLGDPNAVSKRFEELGFVTHFRVIGPFDNEGKRGFDIETPVEAKRMEAPDLQASYPGRERPVSWRELPDVVRSGFVPFGAVMRPFENVCGLAETFVQSDRARPLSLWVGAGGAVKVYWNGTQVLRDAAYRGPSPDRSVVEVAARAGWNRVLVKACTTNTAWGFQLRIADAQGAPTDGLSYAINTPAALDIQPVSDPKLPAAPVTALSFFEERTKPEKVPADLLADAARYLDLTSGDDPAERRAKQLAERAADQEPTIEHLRLAAKLAEERAEVMRFIDRAAALKPKDPGVLLMRAELVASGPSPEQALPLLDQIPAGGADAVTATLLRARIVRGLELPLASLTLLRDLEKRIGPCVTLLRELIDLEGDASQADAAQNDRTRLLALRYDDGDTP